MRTLLSVLHHRISRSFDFLGTVLKVAAGTPDASDFLKIRIAEAELVDTNSRQITITKSRKKTDTNNTIIKARKNDLVDTPQLHGALLTKNRQLTNTKFNSYCNIGKS